MTVLLSWQKTRPEKSRGPPEQLRFNISVEKNMAQHVRMTTKTRLTGPSSVVRGCGSEDEGRVVGMVG